MNFKKYSIHSDMDYIGELDFLLSYDLYSSLKDNLKPLWLEVSDYEKTELEEFFERDIDKLLLSSQQISKESFDNRVSEILIDYSNWKSKDNDLTLENLAHEYELIDVINREFNQYSKFTLLGDSPIKYYVMCEHHDAIALFSWFSSA